MTLLDHFHDLFRYERWANEQVYPSLESIPADRRHGEAYDRLMSLIPHNLIARRVWRWRIRGDAYDNPKAWFPPMTVAEMRTLGAEVDAEWQQYMGELKDADLSREITYRTSDGAQRTRRLDILLTHVFNHATYHRGQIARLVTEHGGQRAVTDYPLAFQ